MFRVGAKMDEIFVDCFKAIDWKKVWLSLNHKLYVYWHDELELQVDL